MKTKYKILLAPTFFYLLNKNENYLTLSNEQVFTSFGHKSIYFYGNR